MVKVECDGCGAPYTVSEKRIPATGLKMRCPKCGASFVVTHEGAAASPPAAAAPKPAARQPADADLPMPAPPRPRAKPPAAEADLPPPPAAADEYDLPPPPMMDDDDLPSPAALAGAGLAADEFGEEADLPMPAADEPALPAPRGPRKPPAPPKGLAPAPNAPTKRTLKSVGAPLPPAAKPPIFSKRQPDAELEANLPALAADLPAVPKAAAGAATAAAAAGDGFGVLDLGLPGVGDGDGLGPLVGTEADLPVPAEPGLPAAVGRGMADAGHAAADADLPAPLDADLPQVHHGNLPSPVEAGLPQVHHGNLPSPVQAGLPQVHHGNLPSPVEAGLPQVHPGNLPSPVQAGLPQVSQGNLPTPADPGLPQVSEGNLPQPMAPDLPLVSEGDLPHSANPELPLVSGDDLPPMGGGPPLPPPTATDPPQFGDIPAAPADNLSVGLDGPPARPASDLDIGPAASEAFEAPGSEADIGGVGDEFRLDAAQGAADEVALEVPPGLASDAEAADREAPLVQIAPKRSRRLRIFLFVLALLALGGAALELTPLGAYGRYAISDTLNRSDHDRSLQAAREQAQSELESDTAAAASAAISQAQAARQRLPRFGPMTSYTTFLVFMKGLRFGTESQDRALGKQLLSTLDPSKPHDVQTLARAAADAADGQLARARQALDGLAQRQPEDIDVAVLGAEIALRAKTPKPALEAWQAAVKLKKSARTLFGLARAQLAAGDAEAAEKTAREVVKLSETHASARTLIASLMAPTRSREKEALELLEEVTTKDSKIAQAASSSELVDAYSQIGEIHIARSRYSPAEKAFAAALKLDPQAERALIGNGEMFYRAGRYSEALARFEAALRVSPDSVDAKVGTAKTWLAQERSKEAKELMQKTLAAGSKNPEVGYWLGKAEESAGERSKAETAYRRAIKIGAEDPRVVSAYVALAELLASLDKDADAREVLAEASGKLPNSPELHNAKGDVALQSGRLEEAKEAYLAALQLEPEHPGAKFKLGITLRRNHEFDEAARYFDEVGGSDPNYPGLALERGLLFAETGQIERALEMYGEALKKAPNDLDLKLRVGSTQVISGHAKQAIPLLREVLGQRGQSAEANHFLGRAWLVERTNLHEALRLLKKATELDPNRAEYFLYLGWAANEAGQPPAVAKEALDQALKLDHSLGDIYWQQGVLLQRRGATKDALRELSVALEKNPSRFEAYATMALCFQDQTNWPAAEQAWRKAIEGNDRMAEWHYRLGKIVYQKGNKAAAAPHLAKAVELTDVGEHARGAAWLHDAHFLLGDALKGSDPAKAVVHFKRYLKLAPNDHAYRVEAEQFIEQQRNAARP